MGKQNPNMSASDIAEFRRTVIKCITKDFTPAEKEEIDRRKKEMEEIERSISARNNGINPILGY